MRRGYPAAAVLLAAALSTGCGIVYTNVHLPRAYRSPTPADVKSSPADEAVSGEACNYSLLFLAAWGDGGYAAATRKALEGRPDKILYDVKSDVKATSFLVGLYSRVCTRVSGRAGRL